MFVGNPCVLCINGVQHAGVIVKAPQIIPNHAYLQHEVRCDVVYFDPGRAAWCQWLDVPYHISGPLPENGTDAKPVVVYHDVGGPPSVRH